MLTDLFGETVLQLGGFEPGIQNADALGGTEVFSGLPEPSRGLEQIPGNERESLPRENLSRFCSH